MTADIFTAGIDFFFDQEKIEYIKLPNFINNQVNKKIKDIDFGN